MPDNDNFATFVIHFDAICCYIYNERFYLKDSVTIFSQFYWNINISVGYEVMYSIYIDFNQNNLTLV